MRKYLLMILLLLSVTSAQYNAERSTEQSFERSGLFFKSYFLNTFGMKSFKNVSVGLIDDPFLNLSLNPAIRPKLGEENTYFYLDFRGDRTSQLVVDQYVMNDYYRTDMAYSIMPDQRLNYLTRDEAEPVFTLGVLTYPIPEVTKDLFIGATYQIIHSAEKYYSTPFSIYNSRFGYAADGTKAEGLSSVPIKDRFSSKDEMLTDAYLISTFAGYKISEKLDAGLSLNIVSHNRTGGYLRANYDEYGNTKNSFWENMESRDRVQDYSHSDISGGINYTFSEKFSGGMKVGMLSGDADQSYNSLNYYNYKYVDGTQNSNWSNNYSNSSTNQSWKHDGNNKYVGFNFAYIPSEVKTITGYYKYSSGNEDLTSSSRISDTSNYNSQWNYDYNNNKSKSNHSSQSSAKDLRSGSGTRKNSIHEGMINFGWSLTPSVKLKVGIYLNKSFSEIRNEEPVIASRYSEYHSVSTGTNPYKYDYLHVLNEDKNLVWEYTSDYWTVQNPILMQFDFNDHFGLLLGINRTLEGWEIQDKTTAYFKFRERNENGTVKKETNFGERYTQPSKKITENSTKFITKFHAYVTPSLKINVLLEPEFENQFRVAQWWLSFEAKL